MGSNVFGKESLHDLRLVACRRFTATLFQREAHRIEQFIHSRPSGHFLAESLPSFDLAEDKSGIGMMSVGQFKGHVFHLSILVFLDEIAVFEQNFHLSYGVIVRPNFGTRFEIEVPPFRGKHRCHHFAEEATACQVLSGEAPFAKMRGFIAHMG